MTRLPNPLSPPALIRLADFLLPIFNLEKDTAKKRFSFSQPIELFHGYLEIKLPK